jgi:hypothetical protein
MRTALVRLARRRRAGTLHHLMMGFRAEQMWNGTMLATEDIKGISFPLQGQ